MSLDKILKLCFFFLLYYAFLPPFFVEKNLLKKFKFLNIIFLKILKLFLNFYFILVALNYFGSKLNFNLIKFFKFLYFMI